MDERSLFLAALEMTDPAARAAWLDAACQGNAGLRERVEALLRTHDDAGSFLERPPAECVSPTRVGTVETPDGPVSLEFLAPSAAPGSLGRLDHYEVLQALGRGGMGIVLKARDTLLERVVAIKMLAPELAANPQARRRFLREAKAAAAVAHPHVVTIHGVEEQRPYLVMEFIAGQSLKNKLERTGPLELKEILRIGSQIAAGLAEAHRQGLIHRDVKPANILLENGVQRVKLTDFGLARAVDDIALTRTGEVAGTPQFMSPEQAQGGGVDHRSDLFSLGSVLYTMCTGRPPFRGDTTIAVIRRVCDDAPRPIRETNPEIPEWLCDIIDRLLEKNPADRFQTAQEVSDLLAQHLAHVQQPLCAPQPPPVARRTRPTASRAAEPRRAPKTLAAAAILVIAFAGLGLAFGPQAVRYVRGAGTLEILADDPHVQVAIDGTMLPSRPDGALTLPQGEHFVSFYKDGACLDQQTVTVRRGGHQAIQMRYYRLTTRPAPSSGTTPAAAPAESGKSAGPSAPDRVPTEGFVSLFNGRDETGWLTHPDDPGTWRVEDGALTTDEQAAYLYSAGKDYADFHLRCEARINAGGDAGVIFRAPFELAKRSGLPGYEAQISAGPLAAAGWTTGAIGVSTPTLGWRLLRAAEPSVQPDEWFVLEVIVRGAQIETRVDGQPVALYVDEQQQFTRGRIVLQSSGGGTRAAFRRIEVRDLSSAAPPQGD